MSTFASLAAAVLGSTPAVHDAIQGLNAIRAKVDSARHAHVDGHLATTFPCGEGNEELQRTRKAFRTMRDHAESAELTLTQREESDETLTVGAPAKTAAADGHAAARVAVAEGARLGVTVVKEAVAEWKRQRREVVVPLTYRLGDLAEVDFFEVFVDVDGTRRKAWLFLMRLMYSGRDFAWIYERQDQISFLDGHVRAFAHVDGVPARVAYDNLRAAVVRILVGGARMLTPRFAALASHYLVEPCFCRPGEGHDKGGVESRGRAVRQQALVPIPVGPSLATINETLLAQMDARLDTKRDAAGRTIGERFTEEQRQLRGVATPFAPEAHGKGGSSGLVRPPWSSRPYNRVTCGSSPRHTPRSV